MPAKSRQDISALGDYRRLAAWLDSDSSDFYGKGWNRQRPRQRGSSRCGLQQFSAFSCLVFVFVFGFLFSVVFLLFYFFLAIFHATCANFLRDGAWMMQRRRGAGAGFVFMFRKSKFRYLQIAGQASLFPLAVLWPTFRFFLLSLCTFFLRKRFSVCRKFFMVWQVASCRQQNKGQICVIFWKVHFVPISMAVVNH